jgi:hypothetical protein
MRINDPTIVAEVEAAFAQYESALMSNDLDRLDAFFWTSDRTVRFGPGQNLYGTEAIVAFRAARVGGSPQRTLLHTIITTFGADFATANTEFLRVGDPRPGRQSQTWVRTEAGWRVVCAHISFLTEGS